MLPFMLSLEVLTCDNGNLAQQALRHARQKHHPLEGGLHGFHQDLVLPVLHLMVNQRTPLALSDHAKPLVRVIKEIPRQKAWSK